MTQLPGRTPRQPVLVRLGCRPPRGGHARGVPGGAWPAEGQHCHLRAPHEPAIRSDGHRMHVLGKHQLRSDLLASGQIPHPRGPIPAAGDGDRAASSTAVATADRPLV